METPKLTEWGTYFSEEKFDDNIHLVKEILPSTSFGRAVTFTLDDYHHDIVAIDVVDSGSNCVIKSFMNGADTQDIEGGDLYQEAIEFCEEEKQNYDDEMIEWLESEEYEKWEKEMFEC